MRRSTAPSQRPSPLQSDDPAPPLAKKPRIESSVFVNPPRASDVPRASAPSVSSTPASDADITYEVVWRKKQFKKHKTWEGDGYLEIKGGTCILLDSKRTEIGRDVLPKTPLEAGALLSFGGKEIEISGIASGRAQQGLPSSDEPQHQAAATPKAPFKPLSINPKAVGSAKATQPKPAEEQSTPDVQQQRSHEVPPDAKAPMAMFKAFRGLTKALPKSGSAPRHDPKSSQAYVLPRPLDQSSEAVDVVIDPYLNRHLRPHQRDGVKFLYERIMGIHDGEYKGNGAILADEMGLGKTLQTITLIWTLLKQSPSPSEGSVIKKALVVCPASLVSNWEKEFNKWLGKERIRVFAMDQKSNIKDFIIGRVYSVLIIGYERLRSSLDTVINCKFDLVVCDEGHRIKNSKIKAASAIQRFQTPRRIILSGTPIQNDLGEFFAMVDFVNPGILGEYASFKRKFENPIVASRDASCNPYQAELGTTRSEELRRITSSFILRRTADINAQYLPSRTEYVLFCRPSEVQSDLLAQISASQFVSDTINGSGASILGILNTMRKLAGSPQMIVDDLEEWNLAVLPEHEDRLLGCQNQLLLEFSGKLCVLADLLHNIKTNTSEKVVVVSNWTQIIQELCTQKGYTFARLDGSVPAQNRQKLVDDFNNTSRQFVFLLSSKAGGVGLNLIGASRLIMFDIDWNPSVCRQAMARIWRDGQKRPVKIYRLLLTGSIEERIFQRQIKKLDLSDAIVDQKGQVIDGFDPQELRDLLTFRGNTKCLTHEIMTCGCQWGAEELDRLMADEPLEGSDDSGEWNHYLLLDQSDTRERWRQHLELLVEEGRLEDDSVLIGSILDRPGSLTFMFQKTDSSPDASDDV